MTSRHWADDHVESLKRHFPELATVPIYVRTTEEVPSDIGRMAAATAWTSPSIDLELMPHLEQRHEWHGRGFVVVVERAEEFLRDSWIAQMGVLLHEMGHWLADHNCRLRRDPAEWSEFDHMLATEAGRQSILRTHNIEPLSDDETQKAHHGPAFTRAALHCWWRCRYSIPLNHLLAFSPRYGSPDESSAIEALRDELREATNIVDITRTPLPEGFAKLWATA